MSEKKRLIVFGRQGAGKGTQCARLVDHFGLVHFSTGDALRATAASDTPLGRELKEILDSGRLVDDDVMIRLVVDRLNQADIKEQGYVLDGFPRRVAQAEALVESYETGTVPDGEIEAVIHLEVPRDEAEKRMAARGRSDDTPEAIAARLDLYDRQTLPVLDWFNARGLLITVDGVGSEDEVAERLIGSLQVPDDGETGLTSPASNC